MFTKRGQSAAGAAVLLAIIMGLIILFIILLPPAERAKLLDESSTSNFSKTTGTSGVKTVNENLLRSNPGRLSYLSETSIDKVVPSTRVVTKDKSTILTEKSYITTKKSVFSSKEEKIYFEIPDLTNTNNILLSFSIDSYQGDLIILLNNREIFNKQAHQIKPLKLSKAILSKKNTLTFKVSSPGAAFWRTNKYDLSKIKVVAQVNDISGQESKNLFNIKTDEAKNIESVSLRFSLSCSQNNMGKLSVKINDYLVFSGVPNNCEDLMYYKIPPSKIKAGSNWLLFKVDKGDYSINQISVKIKRKKVSYPVYYFDLNKKYFTASSSDATCGVVDGLCPTNCGEDVDKDCCFATYSTPYWCDTKTKNSGDRCVGSVDLNDCSRCVTGYEDKTGEAPSNCEGLCGDDTDNYCPSGCQADYDKDCCFEKAGSQFWCADLPTSGLDFTCLNSVSSGQCNICDTGYNGESESTSCPAKKTTTETNQLKSAYDLLLSLDFADDEKKEAEIYVNGHKISFDTYKTEFSRNIKRYATPWTNSIKIIPKNSFDLKTLKVDLKSK